MASELLPFDPNKVSDLIKQGKIKVVSAPSAPIATTPTEGPAIADRMMERAKDLLGKDFLGLEAVRAMGVSLRAVGVNVEFGLDNIPPLDCNERDLEVAKQNGEMLDLRIPLQRVNGQEEGITMMNFRELFRQDPTGNIATLFYSFRPDASDWYPTEDFAKLAGEIKLEWSFVKKEVLNGSTSKTWNQQENLLKKYGEDSQRKGASRTNIGRRTAMEVVWDTLLYYTNTGERLLDGKYDWTKSFASYGRLVLVGAFVSGGLGVYRWSPGRSHPRLGVCPSR